ncbi:MAG: hypothetical protein KF680_07810 [Cryobacterium sp.]|nr:hypothetical protein [Cryobacterium sp.]
MSQLTFDLDQMIHEADLAAAPAWTGPAPLHFTTDYHDPADLAAAFERYKFEHGNLGCIPHSHMWHNTTTMGNANTLTDGHDLLVLSADLRCWCWPSFKGTAAQWAAQGKCSCVGALVTQTICEPCRWHHIAADENTAVEAWHDHAWPGWRALPVVPSALRKYDNQNKPSPKFAEWILDNYPLEWQQPGAPILTERAPNGTRHVPQRSPWGGFDLSAPRDTTP